MNDRDIHSGGTGRVIEATCTRCQSLTVSPRAANQLLSLEPNDAASILDTLRGRSFAAGASLGEVATSDTAYQCFMGRHKDGSRVLLAVTLRPRGP